VSEREATVHPFRVFLMDGVNKSTQLGGSDDNVSAVLVACTVWSTIQNASPNLDTVVEVFDSTDTAVAVVGRAWGQAQPPVMQPVAEE
jgi:hypothetical protein